jgi:hypothetical protein
MERISRAFEDIISELGIEKAVTIENLRARWEEIIGATISIHTYPSFYKNGQLIINVDSPEWLNELKYHKESILTKLKPFEISSVRFKLGRLKKNASRFMPGVRHIELNEQEKDFAEDTASQIDDSSLRETIRKAIERSLVNSKKRSSKQ